MSEVDGAQCKRRVNAARMAREGDFAGCLYYMAGTLKCVCTSPKATTLGKNLLLNHKFILQLLSMPALGLIFSN